MAARITFTTRLAESVPRTPGTVSFRFEKPKSFTYKAGQWFILTVPSAEGPLVHRFTFSSAPTEPFLEFTTRMSGSTFKNALLEMVPGTEVEMEAPIGKFVLRDGVERMACLIGGVGVTPVRSILRSLADAGACDRKIVVFYGNVAEDGITFKEELEAIQAQLPDVRVVHVLSRPGDDWSGHRGRIRAEIVDGELADPGEWTYYVCGPPPMVESMQEVLEELKIPRTQVVLEKFGAPPA